MIRVLFVIDSLACGGAEKSLTSLLGLIDYKKYEVYLLMFKKGGAFEAFVPSQVHILPAPEYFGFLAGSKSIAIFKKVKFLFYRIKTTIKLRVNIFTKVRRHSEQIVYASVKSILDDLNNKFHVAIAYGQGFPTYFVAEKVNADKKLAWINTDYVNAIYNKECDSKFYNKLDSIIVVSQYTYDSISKLEYDYKNKLRIIRDIVNPEFIARMSLQEYPSEFNHNTFKIVTVGRLDTVKGYDLAVKTACLLKENGYQFVWYAVGEGPIKNQIKQLIDKYELKDSFRLLGLRVNPYPYIKNCDIYVQTSIKEGFGLTVIEAKILRKPIICTNFETAYEILEDKIDGFIVNKDEKEIFMAVKNMIDNKSEYNRILDTLSKIKPYNTEQEIEKFYDAIH